MHIYRTTIAVDAIFITSLLLAIAYARWHYWWRSWFGRNFMVLMIALATIRLRPLADELGLIQNSGPDVALKWVSLTGSVAALAVLIFLLVRTVWLNVFHPDRLLTAGGARHYLEHTPGASEPEIRELIAYWDSLHAHVPSPRDYSDASVQPDHDTP